MAIFQEYEPGQVHATGKVPVPPWVAQVKDMKVKEFEALVKRAGLEVQTVRNLARGKGRPSLDNALAIAGMLGLTVEEAWVAKPKKAVKSRPLAVAKPAHPEVIDHPQLDPVTT